MIILKHLILSLALLNFILATAFGDFDYSKMIETTTRCFKPIKPVWPEDGHCEMLRIRYSYDLKSKTCKDTSYG